MDLRVLAKLALLISVWLSALEARVESSRSVIFFDSPSHSYIRHQPLETTGETNFMLLDEVAAAISVLLGLHPPSLSAESSFKLNEVLLPNPFERPDSVFLLEVGGIDGFFLSTQNSDFKVGHSFSSMVVESKMAKIHVPGEEDVYVVHVDESACNEDDVSCVDKELFELAKWFGGSYTGSLKSQDGKLTIPLSTGSSLVLDVAKEADRKFAASLASLFENTMRTVLLNEFAQSSVKSAELFVGRFRGLEALEVEYGEGDILKLGAQLVKDSLIKLFNTLRESSNGKMDDESDEDAEVVFDEDDFIWSTIAKAINAYDRRYDIRDQSKGKMKASSTMLNNIATEDEDDEDDEEDYALGNDKDERNEAFPTFADDNSKED